MPEAPLVQLSHFYREAVERHGTEWHSVQAYVDQKISQISQLDRDNIDKILYFIMSNNEKTEMDS